MLRTVAGLVAAVIAFVGSGARSSELCATEGRLRAVSCCCLSLHRDAAPRLTCCVPDNQLAPSRGALLGREPLGAVGPAVAEPFARMAHDEEAALARAGNPRGATDADTGRVLRLRI